MQAPIPVPLLDRETGRREVTPQALDHAIAEATLWLDRHQDPAGYWVGKLQSNSCMEAEWLLAMKFLGLQDPELEKGLIQAILNEQRNDGSWEVYWEAPSGDINATVESYMALRAAGLTPDDPVLERARQWIFEQGGLRKTRVFTRYWLALFGEWPWSETPNIPPEVIFFPSWFPISIYSFACWARATMMPLSIMSARRVRRPLPPDRRLDELFPEGRDAFDYSLPKRRALLSIDRLFLAADRWLHRYQQLGRNPGREQAIRAVLDWIVNRQDSDGAWGGIQPPWIYSLLALHVEGYDLDHPVMRKGLEALRAHWSYEREGGLYIQASESPVWDTVLSLLAFQDAGVAFDDSPTMQRAVRWLLDQQVREPGDWMIKTPHAPAGAWAFERANKHYPDIDDTAVAVLVLARLPAAVRAKTKADQALYLASQWLLAMQSSNGGWAAFDRDNDMKILTRIPFCDFGEALDPPSVDVTAHVIEALACLNYPANHPSVRRGIDFILREQEAEGCWFGRWGVNYIYGTAAAVPALGAIGHELDSEHLQRAGRWLVACQNDDGGWGETCASYMDPRMKGRGPSTPSQTAWALMALLALGAERWRPAIAAGLEFLVQNQTDGSWEEPYYTGTGFPGYGIGERVEPDGEVLHQGCELGRGFMINYNLYRHYFPLMAMGRARRQLFG